MVVTPHLRPALLTCSEDDSKRNPRHLSPPSSNTGQQAYGIFISATIRLWAQKARSLYAKYATFLRCRHALTTAEGLSSCWGTLFPPVRPAQWCTDDTCRFDHWRAHSPFLLQSMLNIIKHTHTHTHTHTHIYLCI